VLSWQLTPSVALDPLHRCSFQQNEGLSGVCQPFVISFAMRGGKKFTAGHSDRHTLSTRSLKMTSSVTSTAHASPGKRIQGQIFLQSVDKFTTFMPYLDATLLSSHETREVQP
jgi:hypothetical protein